MHKYIYLYKLQILIVAMCCTFLIYKVKKLQLLFNLPWAIENDLVGHIWSLDLEFDTCSDLSEQVQQRG